MEEFKLIENYLIMSNFIVHCELKFLNDDISISKHTIDFFKREHMEIDEIRSDRKFTYVTFKKNDN